MALLSTEVKSQKLATEHLQKGYELIETKVQDQRVVYLLGKEHGDMVDIVVVQGGEVTFKKEWKKANLISLKMITEAAERQLNSSLNS